MPPATDQTCRSCTFCTVATRMMSRTIWGALRFFGAASIKMSTVSRRMSEAPFAISPAIASEISGSARYQPVRRITPPPTMTAAEVPTPPKT